ncbi:MAG: DUF3783 domain-containing protein [Firmicutes bacterium]|nr:DUF3783 domain-containing protein [Bacillota bacterium]
MKKQIFLFSVSEDQAEKIREFCLSLDIEVMTVERRNFAKPLGRVLGIPTDATPASANAVKPYRMTGFPSPMMVFCGLEQEDLDSYLSGYAAAGIEKIALKAVLTPHNVSWTAEQLYDELMEEHRSFAQRRQ